MSLASNDALGPIHTGCGGARKCCLQKVEPIVACWSVHTALPARSMDLCFRVLREVSLGVLHKFMSNSEDELETGKTQHLKTDRQAAQKLGPVS